MERLCFLLMNAWSEQRLKLKWPSEFWWLVRPFLFVQHLQLPLVIVLVNCLLTIVLFLTILLIDLMNHLDQYQVQHLHHVDFQLQREKNASHALEFNGEDKESCECSSSFLYRHLPVSLLHQMNQIHRNEPLPTHIGHQWIDLSMKNTAAKAQHVENLIENQMQIGLLIQIHFDQKNLLPFQQLTIIKYNFYMHYDFFLNKYQ